MCHSVGVSRMGSPARLVTCLRPGRPGSGRSRPPAPLGRHPPAQRGPHPGQQLGHAERLGHVVVGAGVEGLDLVGLAARADSTRIGTDDQPRSPHDLDAVDAREAEVEDHEVGVAAGGEVERLLPVPARSTV